MKRSIMVFSRDKYISDLEAMGEDTKKYNGADDWPKYCDGSEIVDGFVKGRDGRVCYAGSPDWATAATIEVET